MSFAVLFSGLDGFSRRHQAILSTADRQGEQYTARLALSAQARSVCGFSGSRAPIHLSTPFGAPDLRLPKPRIRPSAACVHPRR